MKRTIRTLGGRFNAGRMEMEDTSKCYVPGRGRDFERHAGERIETR